MPNKILVVVITILFFTALGLGVAIYKKNSPKELTDILFENRFGDSKRGSEELGDQKSKYKGEESPIISFLPTAEELGIIEDERAALAHPSKDASAEEKDSHLNLVRRIAKEATVLDITKCKIAEPVVFKAKVGEAVKVKNSDDTAHTIVFDQENTHNIPASTTVNITPAFEFGAGTYGYGCDQTPHAVGLFLVAP